MAIRGIPLSSAVCFYISIRHLQVARQLSSSAISHSMTSKSTPLYMFARCSSRLCCPDSNYLHLSSWTCRSSAIIATSSSKREKRVSLLEFIRSRRSPSEAQAPEPLFVLEMCRQHMVRVRLGIEIGVAFIVRVWSRSRMPL